MEQKKIRKYIILSIFCFVLLCWLPAESFGQDYIVKLKETPVTILSEAAGDEILTPMVPEWNLYQVQESDIEKVMQMPGVVYAEPVVDVYLAEEMTVPVMPDDLNFSQQWNLEMIGMPKAWYWGITGENIRIGVIDSGIDDSHEDLIGRVVAAQNYANDDHNDHDLSHVDPSNTEDTVGHGTRVAGIAAATQNNQTGIAGISEAEIVSLKVVGKSGQGNTLFMLDAIKDAVDVYHCDVINMSLGFGVDVQSIREAVEYALVKGVIVVAASGNKSSSNLEDTAIRYPAGYDGVIGVGSVNKNKEYYFTSVDNETVDVCAPGVSVLSTSSSGGYSFGTGTSFASPHVAAAAALAKELWPEMDADAFLQILENTSADLGDLGKDNQYGWGLLNIPGIMEKTMEHSEKKVMVSRVLKTDSVLSVEYRNVSNQPIKAFQAWGIYDKETGALLRVIENPVESIEANGILKAEVARGLAENEIAKSIFWDRSDWMRPLLPAVE